MEDIVINKVPSNTASPKDIFIDLQPTPPFTEAVFVKYGWRFNDEPTSVFQPLGQQTVGFPFQVPFDPQGRAVRISQIGVDDVGVQSAYDFREGVQTVYTPDPTLGILTDSGEALSDGGNVLENLR